MIGAPDRKQTEGIYDIWRYNLDVAWRGIAVWLVLPVPLLAPVGMNDVVVRLEGDTVREAYYETSENTFVGCILILATCGNFRHGCPPKW